LKNGDRFTGFEAPFHSRKNARVGAEAIIDSYQKTPDKQLHFHTNLSF
jgi:hypothetical protein